MGGSSSWPGCLGPGLFHGFKEDLVAGLAHRKGGADDVLEPVAGPEGREDSGGDLGFALSADVDVALGIGVQARQVRPMSQWTMSPSSMTTPLMRKSSPPLRCRSMSGANQKGRP